jgi:hypothetical protein
LQATSVLLMQFEGERQKKGKQGKKKKAGKKEFLE